MNPNALEGAPLPEPPRAEEDLLMCVLPAPLGAGNLEQRRQCARQGDESKLHRSPFRILVVLPIRLLSQPPPECSGEDVTRISGTTKETLKSFESLENCPI